MWEGQGWAHLYLRWGLFSYILGSIYANYQKFPIKWSLGRNSQILGITLKMTESLRVSPQAPFYWKLLIIGIVIVKNIRKKVPAPSTPSVIRGVLLQSEGPRKDLQLYLVSSMYLEATYPEV